MMTLQGQCNSIRRSRWSPKRSQRLPVYLCVGCSGMSRHKSPGQLAALRGHQIRSDFAADLLNLAVKSGIPIPIISYLLESVWSTAGSVHAGPSRGIVYTLSSVLWKKFCLMSPALMKMKCRTQSYCTNDHQRSPVSMSPNVSNLESPTMRLISLKLCEPRSKVRFVRPGSVPTSWCETARLLKMLKSYKCSNMFQPFTHQWPRLPKRIYKSEYVWITVWMHDKCMWIYVNTIFGGWWTVLSMQSRGLSPDAGAVVSGESDGRSHAAPSLSSADWGDWTMMNWRHQDTSRYIKVFGFVQVQKI